MPNAAVLRLMNDHQRELMRPFLISPGLGAEFVAFAAVGDEQGRQLGHDFLTFRSTLRPLSVNWGAEPQQRPELPLLRCRPARRTNQTGLGWTDAEAAVRSSGGRRNFGSRRVLPEAVARDSEVPLAEVLQPSCQAPA